MITQGSIPIPPVSMAALLLSAAGMLRVREVGARGLMEPGGYGEWHWCHVCNVWVPGDWEAHRSGSRHYDGLRIIMVQLTPICSSSTAPCTPAILVHMRSRTALWTSLA